MPTLVSSIDTQSDIYHEKTHAMQMLVDGLQVKVAHL